MLKDSCIGALGPVRTPGRPGKEPESMHLFQKYSLTRRIYILFSLTIALSLTTSLIFYFISYRSMQQEKARNVENVCLNLVQNTEDIAASVMLMSETISTTPYTRSILTETNPAKKVSPRQFLNRLITRLIKSNSHIHNILLLDSQESIYSFSSFDYSLADRLNQEYRILSPGAYPDGFTGALRLSDEDTVYYAYIQTIYDDSAVSSVRKEIGTCVIICYCSPLGKLCSNSATSQEALFAILDGEDQILACNQELAAAYRTLAAPDSKDCLLLSHRTASPANWRLVCAVPYGELYSELGLISRLAALLILIPFLAFLLLARQISANVTSPLTKIVDFLGKDSYYILHHSLETKGSAEIATLTVNINRMLTEINDLSHTVLQNQAHMYETELAKNQARLLALQTQINPHFLYNTLSAIQGMAYQKKTAEICTAVTALSYMMRYNVNGDSMTSVESEFLCIEKYLQIIALRFPGCFRFRLHMEDGTGDCQMPRFLLQPLVENAVSHGLEPRQPLHGTLTLTASLLPGSILHFECRDDGIGIPPETLENLRREIDEASMVCNPQPKKHAGIGLPNIHMRIRLIYGAPYGLQISSSREGTCVCADFPVSSEASARAPVQCT